MTSTDSMKATNNLNSIINVLALLLGLAGCVLGGMALAESKKNANAIWDDQNIVKKTVECERLLIRRNDEHGTTDLIITSSESGGGLIHVLNSAGKAVAVVSSSERGGIIQVLDPAEKNVATIDSTLVGGRMVVRNATDTKYDVLYPRLERKE